MPVNRRPPRPETWNSPKGNCRFCGLEIIDNGVQNKRKNWHKDCLRVWLVMSSPREAKRFVWHRDKGVCQGCGKDSWSYMDYWEVDHRKPLFEATDLSYWHPDNLQILCGPCHKSKNKEEAARRRKSTLKPTGKDIDQTDNN
jgi:5-methylcytosine-specific restriction endonuclease McrA